MLQREGRKRLGSFFPNKPSHKAVQRKNSYSSVGENDSVGPETPILKESQKHQNDQYNSDPPGAPKKNKSKLMSYFSTSSSQDGGAGGNDTTCEKQQNQYYEHLSLQKTTPSSPMILQVASKTSLADDCVSDILGQKERKFSTSLDRTTKAWNVADSKASETDDPPHRDTLDDEEEAFSSGMITPPAANFRSLSPIEPIFESEWMHGGSPSRFDGDNEDVPFDVGSFDAMKPCKLWEYNESSSIPPKRQRNAAVHDDTPSPSPQTSFVEDDNTNSRIVCPKTPDEIMGGTKTPYDDKERDVIMTVTPNPMIPNPAKKGYSNLTDISPLTMPPAEFAEPIQPKEAPRPADHMLMHPLSPNNESREGRVMLKDPNNSSSLEEGNSYSFDEQPTCESSFSIQEFMKENEEQKLNLYIDDIQETTFDSIVQSFYGNVSLKMLTIVRSSQQSNVMGDYRTPQEMKILFDAIRCLPNLQFLALINLKEDVLEDLMDMMPSYRGFKFQLHMSKGTLSSPFLGALAQAPNLKQVQLHVNESLNLALLLTSTTLRDLRIVSQKFVFDDHHMQLFADCLARNESTVTKLDLQPALSNTSILGLAFALRFNRTLKSLKVCYNCTLGDSDSVVHELTKMLEYNRTITTVYNHSHDSIWVSRKTKENLVNSMKRNRTIQSFEFFQEDPVFSMAKELALKSSNNKKGGQSPNSVQDYMDMFEKYWSCGSLTEVVGCPDVGGQMDCIQVNHI